MTEEMYCRDQDVYIVGAGNSAGQAAMYLSRFARCVKLLARGDSLAKSMSQYLIDELARTANVVVQLQTPVIGAHGENHLESITIANDQTGQTTTAPAVALFICIGATPHTTCVADLIECDARGYILSGADLTLNGRSSAQLAARTQALFALNKRTGDKLASLGRMAAGLAHELNNPAAAAHRAAAQLDEAVEKLETVTQPLHQCLSSE
jgi:signal transduction histidine kinase